MNNRVNILSDFQNAGYDSGDASLLELVDFIRCYHYPNRGVNPRNSIAGYEGDPIYIQVPYRIENALRNGITPMNWQVRLLIVATKNGKEDFVVESYIANLSATCKSNGQQAINISDTKGYTTYEGDPYNSISLKADPTNDVGTKKGYTLQYGLVLRYDYWNQILTTNIGGTTCDNDINNDISNVDNSWSNLASGGWDLKIRFYAEMKGYDGTITPFQAETAINCATGLTPITAGPAYSTLINYFDSNGNITPGIVAADKTRIRVTFTGDGSELPAPFNDYAGSVWADLFNGGPASRRFASTEYNSEVGSPFSDPGNLIGAIVYDSSGQPVIDSNGNNIHDVQIPITNRSDGNVRMATYSDGTIVLETIYDDTIMGWGNKLGQIIISPRLSFKVNDEMMDSFDEDILDSQHQQII